MVTGGAGFIGSNFIHYMLNAYSDVKIVNVDALTYAGNLSNVKGLEKNKNYSFVKADICNYEKMCEVMKDCDSVVNFAAESHVDNSIHSDDNFVKSNIEGTHSLLKAARKTNLKKFMQISTDEVYGSIAKGSATEQSALNPSSPYSASKTAADMLCNAYFHTFGLDVVITRTVNNFGPRQFPEKFIPTVITNALANRKIPIYGNGMQIRNWIYVDDNCTALDIVLSKGKKGEVYNIAGNDELENIKLARKILDLMKKPHSLLEHVTDRLGHDVRYSLDDKKLRAVGFKPDNNLDKGLQSTIDWYTK